MIHTQIADRANGVLMSADAFRSPVDVGRVAEKLGAQIHYESLEDELSGMLVVQGSKKHILVNASHHSNRQRFTIAHEIGHLVLHHSSGDQVFVDTKLVVYQRAGCAGASNYLMAGSTTTPEQEREANIFAASLLMPRALLSEFIERKNLDLADEFDIALLAVAFGVSEQAMSIRLKNLEFVSFTF